MPASARLPKFIMLNLYAKLGIAPDANPNDIQAALNAAGQAQTLPPELLQKAGQILLNEQARKQYNAKLFAEHPEILQEMMAQARQAAMPAPTPTPQNEVRRPKRKIRRVYDADDEDEETDDDADTGGSERRRFKLKQPQDGSGKSFGQWLKHYGETRHQRVGSGCLSTALGVFFGGLMLLMLPVVLLFGSCSRSDTDRRFREKVEQVKQREQEKMAAAERQREADAAQDPQQIGTAFISRHITGGDGSAFDPYVMTARSLARAFKENPDAATTGLSGKTVTLIGRVGNVAVGGRKVYLLGDGDSANVHVDMAGQSAAESGMTVMFGDCRVSGSNGLQIGVYGCVQLKP